MIKSKRELAFFIQADRIMNGFPEKRSILTYMKEFFHPQRDILRFLKLMRKCDYYARCTTVFDFIEMEVRIHYFSYSIKSNTVVHLRGWGFL